MAGTRRYWDGTDFVGVHFEKDYVTRISFNQQQKADPSLAANNGSGIICNQPLVSHLVYVESNDVIHEVINTSTLYSDKVMAQDSPLYVAKDWYDRASSTTGSSEVYEYLDDLGFNIVKMTPPLINIKDQFAYGSTANYYKFICMANELPLGTGPAQFRNLSTPGGTNAPVSPTGKLIGNLFECSSGIGGGGGGGGEVAEPLDQNASPD